MKTEKYNVTGMTCAACQANVTRCVQKLDGVEDVNVSLLANQMTVSYDENKLRPENIISAVEGAGYGASSMEKALEKDTGFRGEWQLRKKQAENSRQSMKKTADLFGCPAGAPYVYSNGLNAGPACPRLFYRHSECACFCAGSAAFNCAYNFYKQAFLSIRL